jgi:Ca2+-binding EF-hand superfamily protein
MKPLFFPSLLLLSALVPALTFAAKGGAPRKSPASDAAPAVSETLKSFDKNGDHKIDASELTAMQQAFSDLKKLDKNGNGEIEAAEVEPARKMAETGRGGRALEGLKKVDKNGNHKIDADEIEGLQTALA